MNRPAPGFSIIELLIVITMLAILAAIAVPRLIDASDEASETALDTDLQMLRRQIVLYKSQHGERGPHLDENGQLDTANFKRRLLERTLPNGKLDGSGPLGPYMKTWPINPYADESIRGDVAFGTQTAPPRDGTTGWYYNTDTCVISANSKQGGEELDPTE